MSVAGDQTIGSVVLEERLGADGAGEVFRARQVGLDRPVLVRKLQRDMLESPALVDRVLDGASHADRFERAARLGSAVLHANVRQVFDSFAHRGEHYLVLEWVDGCDLRTALRRAGRLPPWTAARVALEVARALAEAHAQGVVHADVRPENVWLGRWGEVKLDGFGCARHLGDGVGAPSPLPSPSNAPEIVRGGSPGTASDVFSLGVLLLEAATGDPRRRQRRTRLLELPPRLAALVRRCTAEDPARRPRASEAVERLERAIGAHGAPERSDLAAWLWQAGVLRPRPEAPARRPAPEPKRARRPPLALTLPAAVAAGVAVALLLADLPARPPEPAAPPTVRLPDVGAGPVAGPLPALASFVAYPWAEVEIGDTARFTTPRAEPVELSPGTYRVVFRHPRYGEAQRTLVLASGQQTVVRHVFDEAIR